MGEFGGEAEPGRGNMEWIARVGLTLANTAIREAKESGMLPERAATTFTAMVGSLVTGEVKGVTLGDSLLTEHVATGLRRLHATHDDFGAITKTLEGADEMAVPTVVTVPPPNRRSQLVAHTDGLLHVHQLAEFRGELGHRPEFREPNQLIAEALNAPTAQATAEALVRATEIAEEILLLDGMQNGSDDTSASVLRLYPIA